MAFKYNLGDKLIVTETRIRALNNLCKGTTIIVSKREHFSDRNSTDYERTAYWDKLTNEAYWEDELRPASLKSLLGDLI